MNFKELNLVIKNAKIVDGSGNPWYKSDIGIYNERIVKIGKIKDGINIIDAQGLVACPGFIDTHSHSDLMIMVEPAANQKIMQGITTELVGQDGLGEAPISDETIDDWRIYLAGLNGNPNIDWNWRNFNGYLKALEKAKPATNIASLVGHGNIRLLSMGMENRAPTKNELAEMKRLLAESMEMGAFGLSTGLIYPPCVYADTYELIELCKVSEHYGGIFVVHMRNEGNMLFQSIEEVATIGRDSEVHVHISHFKVSGSNNWGKALEALEKVESYHKKGISITIDQYPYVAGSTFLSSLLPTSAHEGGTKRMLERLRNKNEREQVRNLIKESRGLNWGWHNILVTSLNTPKNKPYEGLNLKEISEMRGEDTVETLFNIILEEKNAVTMVSFNMSEEDVLDIMRSPFQMVCTDGIVLGKPHPRAFGSFPRILGRYVKAGTLRLEDAIRKMTSLPAETLRIRDRGLIKLGMYADITIFNPRTVIDMGTYTDPIQYPKGIEYVIVNGTLTVDNGSHIGNHNGKVLKHS
jgi:N-acyl-D-amino-acid deacylase